MMQADAGVSLAEGGWLAAANYLGYLIGSLWAMLQRARADHAIRSALVMTSIATLAMAFVEGLAAWLAWRTLAGIASAWVLIHMASWCAQRLASLGRPALTSVVFAGVGAGVMLAGALCLALMTAGAGSRTAWLWLGAIGVVISALVWPVVRDTGSEAAAASFADYRWTPDTIRLVACYGAFGIGYIIPATFVPVMAKQVIADPAVFGWAWPVFGAADSERLRDGARRGEPARHCGAGRHSRVRAPRRRHFRGGDARRCAGRARGCGQRRACAARGDDRGIRRNSGARSAARQLACAAIRRDQCSAAAGLRRASGFRRRADDPAEGAVKNLVEWKGIEPSTFALRTRRSPS
jgi:hypothetical protein